MLPREKLERRLRSEDGKNCSQLSPEQVELVELVELVEAAGMVKVICLK
jgi:hypothetical protein